MNKLTVLSITLLWSLMSGTVFAAPGGKKGDSERIDALEERVTELEATNAALRTILTEQRAVTSELQSALAEIQSNTVLALDGYLLLDAQYGNSVARFQGLNVQVVNGTGTTDSANGVGNLIVGYDELRAAGSERCSDGRFNNASDCLSANAIWDANHKSGSHNVVVGSQNSYAQYGGLIAGQANTINGPYASVSGGSGNTASGEASSVSGGRENAARRKASSVSGGRENLATGTNSVVSGGRQNLASGNNSSVSGGRNRSASGNDDWVAGGLFTDN